MKSRARPLGVAAQGAGGYATPWTWISIEQRIARAKAVIDRADEFVHVAERDCYRTVDAFALSPDWCPADAVRRQREGA